MTKANETNGSQRTTESRGGMSGAAQVLKVFDFFETYGREAGVTEVAQALNVHKSTASRLLATLKVGGYLERNEHSGKYVLGVRFLALANAKLKQLDLRTYARPFLEKLAHQTKETVHLSILEQHRLVYIDKIDAQHTLAMRSRIGDQVSPYCTALGKAILSVLPEARRESILAEVEMQQITPNTITDPETFREHLRTVANQGYAFDDEEHEAGVRCAAAPILDHTGSVVGAISISAPVVRMSRQRMEDVGVLVRDTCDGLSRSLGYNKGNPG